MTSRTRENQLSNPDDDGASQSQNGQEAPSGLSPLQIPQAVTVYSLAALMGANPIEVIKEFMRNGFMYSINDVVEHERFGIGIVQYLHLDDKSLRFRPSPPIVRFNSLGFSVL